MENTATMQVTMVDVGHPSPTNDPPPAPPLLLDGTLFRVLTACKLIAEGEDALVRITVGLRFFHVLSLITDIGAAVVSVYNFSHLVECCGEPLINLGDFGFNWNQIFLRLTQFYLMLVILEIYPVLHMGLSLNLINPLFGFTLTIVLFFDEGQADAMIMWCLEALSVTLEVFIFRLMVLERKQLYIEEDRLRLKVGSDDLIEGGQETCKREALVSLHAIRIRTRTVERSVPWFKVAVAINASLVLVLLMFIVLVIRNGGICFDSRRSLNPFSWEQFHLCPLCHSEEFCEVCTPNFKQCHIPFL